MGRLTVMEDIWAYNIQDVFASARSTQSLLCRALEWSDTYFVSCGSYNSLKRIRPRRPRFTKPHRFWYVGVLNKHDVL